MTRALQGTGRFCARRPWIVIGAWVLIALTLGVTARIAGRNTSDNPMISVAE